MRPSDTSPEIHRMQIERYRRMTGEERVLEAAALSAELYEFACAGVRSRHRSYSDEQVDWAVRRLRLGPDLLRRVWPDAPLVAP